MKKARYKGKEAVQNSALNPVFKNEVELVAPAMFSALLLSTSLTVSLFQHKLLWGIQSKTQRFLQEKGSRSRHELYQSKHLYSLLCRSHCLSRAQLLEREEDIGKMNVNGAIAVTNFCLLLCCQVLCLS